MAVARLAGGLPTLPSGGAEPSRVDSVQPTHHDGCVVLWHHSGQEELTLGCVFRQQR